MRRRQHLNLRDQADELLVIHELQIAATYVAHLQLGLQMVFDDERLQAIVILVLTKGTAKTASRPGPSAEAAMQVPGGSELLSTQLGELWLRSANRTRRLKPPVVIQERSHSVGPRLDARADARFCQGVQ